MQQTIKRLHKNGFSAFVANHSTLCFKLPALPFIRLLAPHLCRRLIIEIQMRAAVVIKHPKLIECFLQLRLPFKLQLSQYGLERTE